MSPPILADVDIAWILKVSKSITDPDWRSVLLPPTAGLTVCDGRLDLPPLPDGGPVGGTLHLYSRRNLRPAVTDDWSVGLIYTDYAGNSYRVVRCNSAHPNVHVNRIEGTRIVGSSHVHYLTERYQRDSRAKMDGYAEPTDEFETMHQALDHLGALVNLTPEGILWL